MDRVPGNKGVAFILILNLCTGSLQLFAKDPLKPKAAVNAEVIVLQPADPVPAEAIRLTSIQINGDNPTADCSYPEIMETVKDLAKKADANVIKITQHVLRDQTKDCDEVSATFYKTDDVQALEKEITWQEERKLCWEDFKGPTPPGVNKNAAAATYCGIGFETNTVTDNNKAKVFVYNTFYTNQSWVREGERTPEILAHEQGHFDICEIYTRKLRERMDNANITVHNLKPMLQGIYEEVSNEYESRQQAYENETQHGTIAVQQQKWLLVIAQELSNSKSAVVL